MACLKEILQANWNRIPDVGKALIIFGILYYPIGFVHELGHYTIGIIQKSSCVIHWWLETHCEPNPNNWVYWIMGGIFGTMGSSLLLTLRRIKNTRWFLIGVANIIFVHILFAICEAFAHPLYLHSLIFNFIMGGLIIIFMFFSLLPLIPRSKKIT